MHTVQDGHHTSEAASRQKATKVENTYSRLMFVHFQFSFMALQDLPVMNNKNEMYHFKI